MFFSVFKEAESPGTSSRRSKTLLKAALQQKARKQRGI